MKYKIKYRNSTGRIIEEYFEYNNANVLKLALQDRGIRPETVEEVIESDSQLVERQPLSLKERGGYTPKWLDVDFPLPSNRIFRVSAV